MSKQRLILTIFSTVWLLASKPAFGIQQKHSCSIEYENHDQVDYGPLVVREVKGSVVDPEQYAMSKVCVGVFTEKEHKLVATAESDEEGKFSLQNIPAGQYRLIVKADLLCAANVPLRVVKHQTEQRVLKIHMRPRGLDACSYGESVKAEQPAKSKAMRSIASTPLWATKNKGDVCTDSELR